MARQMKVAPDEALMSAMLLFWRLGFHGAGTRQIEDETGITRFTLQTTYGGKKALFLKALDHYLDLFDQMMLPRIEAGGLEGLAQFFACGMVPQQMIDQVNNGCLMINSITEFGQSDPEVTTRMDRFYAMMRGSFAKALHTAKQAGDLRPEIDTDEAAELLLGVSVAINVANCSAANSANAKALCAAAANQVRSWAA